MASWPLPSTCFSHYLIEVGSHFTSLLVRSRLRCFMLTDFEIDREQKHGGLVSFKTYEDLEQAYGRKVGHSYSKIVLNALVNCSF